MQEAETGRRPSSKRERDLPRPFAYQFANQLETWREHARARSSGTFGSGKFGNTVTDAPKPLLRGAPLSDGTGSFKIKKKGKHQRDSDSGDGSDSDVAETEAKRVSGVHQTNRPKQDRHQDHHQDQQQEDVERTGRAWNSGSLLVRPGSEAPSGRVPRTTYIYLVGSARSEDGVEVEVIVGADEKRTVMSRATGVTSACVPAREAFTVRNLTKGGKTVVLFWTSPSREVGQQHAREHSRGAEGDDKKAEAKRKMPRGSERRSQAPKKSATPATATARFKPDRWYALQ